METASKQPVPWVFWVLIASVVLVLGQSLYENYFAKNYLFYLEAQCDSTAHECYVRSCESDGDCPPNNLISYRVFQIPASEFHNCSDNSCLNICPSSEYSCEEIPCSSQTDISCEANPPQSETTATTATTTTI